MFETADGTYLALGVLTEDHFWRGLCDVLRLGEHRELSFPARMARLDELQRELADRIRQRPRDELVVELLAADVPAAPVLDREGMLALDHLRQRGVVTDGPDVGYPVLFEHHPATRVTPAPALDEHRGQGFLPS
jgi:crotonobetainyl-CoA:carnitine CoA-transferase CaiB-like acyl-CoA transferase